MVRCTFRIFPTDLGFENTAKSSNHMLIEQALKYDNQGDWYELNKQDELNEITNANLISKAVPLNITYPTLTQWLDIDLTDICKNMLLMR